MATGGVSRTSTPMLRFLIKRALFEPDRDARHMEHCAATATLKTNIRSVPAKARSECLTACFILWLFRSCGLFNRRGFLVLVTQVRRPEAVREKHEQQDDADYRHRDQRQDQAQPLELQMHKVGNDQRGLNHRQAQQDGQHEVHAHGLIAKKDLNQSEHYQPEPNEHEQLVRPGKVNLFGLIHACHACHAGRRASFRSVGARYHGFLERPGQFAGGIQRYQGIDGKHQGEHQAHCGQKQIVCAEKAAGRGRIKGREPQQDDHRRNANDVKNFCFFLHFVSVRRLAPTNLVANALDPLT